MRLPAATQERAAASPRRAAGRGCLVAERGDEEKAAGTPQRRRETVGLDAGGGGGNWGKIRVVKKGDIKHTMRKTGFVAAKKTSRFKE